ncbi:WD domain-containing protein, putative [Eimeria brunetti]|uniref:WD domain-containing protein, putative n=1 Tax=Eimeria brunetti TaxID=51314 RepID=U6LN95_9EIME|nr:WD domain-containing protein, putative [Eimeria brunetti]
MGGPQYALRTVARLSEGIRLLSDRILRPHGIGAAVAVLVSQGFVSRSDGVKRGTGAPEEGGPKQQAGALRRDMRRPPLPPDEAKARGGGLHHAAGSKRGPHGEGGPPVLQRPFGTGRLLLRAASSPSALLDSLRRNGSSQEIGEGGAESKGGGPPPGLESLMEGRLSTERGASTTSLEALAAASQQQAATSPRRQAWEESTAAVETEVALALIITEEPPQSGGEGPPPAAGTRERGAPMGEEVDPVLVPTFPPVSSMAVTSPLDPRRLSPTNPTLAPYTAAAATSLQKPVPYWGSGPPPLSTPSYAGAFGGPVCWRQPSDRSSILSPKHQLPGGFRGARRAAGFFSDLSSPGSQSNSSRSPQGAGGPEAKEEGQKDEVLGGPVMSLADAARRSAGADAQHLRDAVQALQKSALAKLGTGPQGVSTAAGNEESGAVSRVTTSAAGPEPDGDPTSLADAGPQNPPQRRGFSPLSPLRLAWRRLRFRSSSTDMARHAFCTEYLMYPPLDIVPT